MEVLLWDAGSLLDGHLTIVVRADDTQTAWVQEKNGVPYIRQFQYVLIGIIPWPVL